MPDPTPANSNHGKPDASSQPVDPGIAGSARQSPYPDVDIYDRPASERISMGNLGLSIAVVAIVAVVAVVLILWIWWRLGGDAAETASAAISAATGALNGSLLPARFRRDSSAPAPVRS